MSLIMYSTCDPNCEPIKEEKVKLMNPFLKRMCTNLREIDIGKLRELNKVHDILAYKSLDPYFPYWMIYEYSYEAETYEFQDIIPFGGCVTGGLNYIVRNAAQNRFYMSDEPNILINEQEDIMGIPFKPPVVCLSLSKTEKLIDHINALVAESEEAKRKSKNRQMSSEDWQRLLPFYLKVKDIAYIAVNRERFGVDYIYDYLTIDGLLPTRTDDIIIRERDEVKLKNTRFKKYTVSDYEAMFALDLRELLFSPIQFPKFQMCEICHEAFVSDHRSNKYCITCNTSERQNTRKRHSREDEVNRLAERIFDRYRFRYERATNRVYFPQSDGTDSRAETVKKKWEEFKREYQYYKKLVAGDITPDTINDQYDNSITTREKLLEWLKKCNNHLDETKGKGGRQVGSTIYERTKKERKNGKTAKTCKRDGSNHESVGQAQETVSSDDNTGME